VFYDKYAQLCKRRGVSMSAAALEAGLSKSLVTKWKTNKVDVPSPDVLKKLSSYFNMPVSELLGEEEKEAKKEQPTEIDGLSEKQRVFIDKVRQMFDEELVLSGDQRRLFVTLGQFSIVRLERDAQLIVPVLDYSIPTKECCDSPGCCAEDPCEMFSRIPFPTAQFAPTGCDGGCKCDNTPTYTTCNT
jgi:transcriptional regulator with XRE-family HTH domain